MKLFDLNEANNISLDLKDPRAIAALKKAGIQFPYAKSELDAFVRSTQTALSKIEQEQKKQDMKVNNLERSMDHYKKRIQDLTKDVKDLQRKIK